MTPASPPAAIPDYAELHCVTHFSFLRGASHPHELVARAALLGYRALAITDECSVAGVVRAHLAVKALPAAGLALQLIIGAEFRFPALAPSTGEPCTTASSITASSTADPGTADPSISARLAADSLASDPSTADSPAAAPDRAPPDPASSRRPARLVLLARNRDGYGHLCELISTARQRAPKGSYRLLADDLARGVPDTIALFVPDPQAPMETTFAQARFVGQRFAGACWIAVARLVHGDDDEWLERLQQVSRWSGLPLVATGDVEFHVRSRKSLQDVLTAIRSHRSVADLGSASAPNAEQHLRSRLRLGHLYPPELLAATLTIAGDCRFSLDSLRYEYPDELVPAGHTPASWLAQRAYAGLAKRYPRGAPERVRTLLAHELSLIADLRYEPYFLTVADLVKFARDHGILCQGRGSAANSVVCYSLFITEVDPDRVTVLFERFLSKERNEPPDIDVDFEHQRREEVIQHLYEKYGRHRAALTATVISYRPRSAMRDVGKALGIDPQRIDLIAGSHQWWDGRRMTAARMAEHGFDPDSLLVRHWVDMTNVLLGFPRHLSQHTGGFVIARDRLTRLVPVENAAMAGRSVIEWDKDDLDALGLLKVDVLALGMLSALRRALALISRRRGLPEPLTLQQIPDDDPATFAMIQRADTIGVFQIESRAQMSMLPRLRPANYYDLVIEVAIVRPGPIQGGMVHPYLRRRSGLEPSVLENEALREALGRTLGIPIFQEQVMQIAMIAADFSPAEADALRRAMAAWKRKGGLEPFKATLHERMLRKGYSQAFAEQIFAMMEGFGDYGFPESHAASFALLVYVSSWIKCHEPAAFLAALLNSQPMGFYAPAQLVRDAREHGVQVRPVDVLASDWESTLEEVAADDPWPPADDPRRLALARTPIAMSEAGDAGRLRDTRRTPSAAHVAVIDPRPQPAVRLGLNRIKGFSPQAAERLVAARQERLDAGRHPPFDGVEDLARAARLDRSDLERLAAADALGALAGHRHRAQWEAAGLGRLPALLQEARFDETLPELRAPTEAQQIVADYRSLGIPMGRHPLALLRPELDRYGVRPARSLRGYPHGRLARASGVVTHRQRPETAKGTVFVTIEDETGAVNVIVHPRLVDTYRKELLGARLMTIYGVWQRDERTGGQVMHLVARRIVDHSWMLGRLETRSRDFH
ncbi:MAG: error-prone DNA polymerase [Burkholderiaceae bacterium]